jgi:predicted phosphoribosyltransferase
MRGGRPEPDVRGRTVIPVDDGLATGAIMHAAIETFGSNILRASSCASDGTA